MTVCYSYVFITSTHCTQLYYCCKYHLLVTTWILQNTSGGELKEHCLTIVWRYQIINQRRTDNTMAKKDKRTNNYLQNATKLKIAQHEPH